VLIKINLSRAYFGPNQHSGVPVVYLGVALGSQASQLLNDSESLLSRWAADILQDPLAAGKSYAGLERFLPILTTAVRCGLPALIETAIRQMVAEIGESLNGIDIRPGSDADGLDIIIHTSATEMVRRAANLALELINALTAWHEGSRSLARIQEDLNSLCHQAASRRPTKTQAAILTIAAERDIPVIRFDRWPYLTEDQDVPVDRRGVMQLGQGIYGQRIRETASARVPGQIYELLADRHLMHQALHEAGLPVPLRDLEFPNINGVGRARRGALRLGFPVVLKPRFSTRGVAVTLDIGDEAQLDQAYRLARLQGRQVVIEQMVPGATYRLLVIGKEVITACKRAQGEGLSSPQIQQPVPADRLDVELRAMAVRAASCFGLAVAGVDLVTADPSVPLRPGQGAIVRVDPAPDLDLHQAPGESLPLTVARHFLAHLFPPGSPSRIPIAAITGTDGKTTTCRMAARVLAAGGQRVGLACSDGVYVGTERIREGVYSGIGGALQLFTDQRVEMAILEVSRGGLVKWGLGFDRARVGGCTNVAADHIGLEGIKTVAAMAMLKATILAHTEELAIVNADDPLSLAMLAITPARQHCLISLYPKEDLLAAHLAAGGSAVTLEVEAQGFPIVLHEGTERHGVIRARDIPATWQGLARHNIQNAMFATAIAVGMGIGIAQIRAGLASFAPTLDDSPGRINRYDRLPFRVILNKSSTATSAKALCDLVDRLTGHPRKILAFHGVGDRRDQDLRALARRVAASFDRFICFDFEELRGRQASEVPRLLGQFLAAEGVSDAHIVILQEKRPAIELALITAQAGDLVVIIAAKGFRDIFHWLDEYNPATLGINPIDKAG
jgi:UDP-N-acetylmuramyl tripeptide synthase